MLIKNLLFLYSLVISQGIIERQHCSHCIDIYLPNIDKTINSKLINNTSIINIKKCDRDCCNGYFRYLVPNYIQKLGECMFRAKIMRT